MHATCGTAVRVWRSRRYFYGNEDLCPHHRSVDLSSVTVVRIGGGPKVSQNTLPIGARSSADDTLKVSAVTQPSAELIHSVLGVSWAESLEAVLSSNVAGFIHVTEVDVLKGRLSFLAPTPGVLPHEHTFLVYGSLKWLETS